MKILILIALTLVSITSLIECGEKNANKSLAEPILDSKSAEELQKALSAIPSEKIPSEFKKPRDDNTHWCCKIDTPIINLHQTRVISYEFTNSQNVVCGTTSCGFLGWKKCDRWCTNYWLETRYHMDYYTVTQQTPCPQDQVICCTDYFYIMNHCFHISEVQSNLELLAALNNQGIVLPGIGK